MKTFKIILIILVVLVGGYSIWMSTIAPEYRVERTAVIDAEPATVYATVSDFKTWGEWSKWHQADPNMEVTYGDKSAGEGATYTWKSDKSGAGTQSITAAVPNESLQTHIAFEGMGESDGYWKFEPTEDGKTKVTWGFTGEMPFFFRVMNLGMDQSVGSDFETGLANLKARVESMPEEEEEAPETAISVVQVESMPYYGIKSDISWSEMGTEFFADNYKTIGEYLQQDMENMIIQPFAIYHEWDEENQRAIVEPAIAVISEKPATKEIAKSSTYAGHAVKAIHMGSYDKTGETHALIDAFLNENDLQPAGAPYEVYVTDPSMEADTAKWVTEIYYPVMEADETATEADEAR